MITKNYKKFTEIALSHKVPSKIKFDIENGWENALVWSVYNNKLDFLNEVCSNYPADDYERLFLILKNLFKLSIDKNSKCKNKTKLFLLNKIYGICNEKSEFIIKDYFINELIEVITKNEDIISLKGLLEISNLMNLKSKSLSYALTEKSSIAYIKSILKLNPEFEYLKDAVPVTFEHRVDLISKQKIGSFKILCEHYKKELKENIIIMVNKLIFDNNYECLKYILSQPNFLSAIQKRMGFQLNTNDKTTPNFPENNFLFSRKPNDTTIEIAKLLKDNKIYSAYEIEQLVYNFLNLREIDNIYKIINEVGLPDFNSKSFVSCKYIALNLIEYFHKEKMDEELMECIEHPFMKSADPETMLNWLLNLNKFEEINKYLDNVKNVNENMILSCLYYKKKFNLLESEDLLKKYVSIDSLKKYCDKQKNFLNVLDNTWLLKMILFKELNKNKSVEIKNTKKLKI